MKISIIAAKSENNVIGLKNRIPWKLSADMEFFKKTTTGHHIIMGRKTFESIGKKPLFDRVNIVLTNNPIYEVPEGVLIVSSLKEGLKIAEMAGEKEVFVIGGQEIYKIAIPLADKMYITEVSCDINGDAFFPDYDGSKWKIVKTESHLKDKKNEYDYTFLVLERKHK